jgi:hypothetical protein
VTGSILLAAAVPAVCWAISYPVTTALFVVVAAIAHTLRTRRVDRSATAPPAVDAAGSAEGR